MKAKALRELQSTELKEKAIQLMREKVELLIQKTNRSLTKTHQLRAIRRDLARIHTISSEE